MDENRNSDLHQKKVESFKLEIPEDQMHAPAPEEGEPGVLHSYSEPNNRQGPELAAARQAKKAEKKAAKKRNREKRRKNRRFFRVVWIVMVLLVSIVLAQFLIIGVNDMLAANRGAAQEITVEIPAEPNVDQIADILQKNHIIEQKNFFKFYSKMRKSDDGFRSGTFKLNTGMDYEALINTLQSNANRLDTVDVRVIEGTNVLDLADQLAKKGVLTEKTKAEFLVLCNSDEFDKRYDFLSAITNQQDRYYKLEGYLFPDTYTFYKDQDPKEVLQKFLSNTSRKLDKDFLDKVKAQSLSLDEVVTLASLIQTEAADTKDMLNISSVFHNRLNSEESEGFFYLNSDPTIYYPYRTKAQVPEDIRESYSGKYNTYKVKGLPAGAICSPGRAALDAAITPAETSYYYFCHNPETHKAYYAKTEKEHLNNLKKAGLR